MGKAYTDLPHITLSGNPESMLRGIFFQSLALLWFLVLYNQGLGREALLAQLILSLAARQAPSVSIATAPHLGEEILITEAHKG